MSNLLTRLATRAEDTATRLAFEACAMAAARENKVAVDLVRRPMPPAAAARASRGAKADRAVAAARQQAIYLTVTVFGRSLRATARAAGVKPAPALRSVRAVEEGRDCPRLDRRLDEIELDLMGA